VHAVDGEHAEIVEQAHEIIGIGDAGGRFFVHGFTLAMTAQNRFYRPISEQDTQAGYVDIFLW